MRALASDHQREERIVRHRIVAVSVIATVLVLVLVVRLAYLQIFEHERFSVLARENHIDMVALPPVRGLIYDRNGEVLAENRLVHNLEVLPAQVEDMAVLLAELERLVGLSEEDVSRFEALLRRRPGFERQILRTNLNPREAARVALHQHRLPGAELRVRLQRHYPYGELTAHVVGYVGRISAADLEKVDQQVYRGLKYIGRTGTETYYEDGLRGESGVEQVEMDAHGRVVRRLPQVAASTGQSLHLSLDVGLQRESIEALQGFEGAVVAIEPGSGEVLAFASAPAFDANLFVNGISQADFSGLRDNDARPLLNRALSGRYAPGSTIKGFMLMTGMANGIDPSQEVFCPGWYRLPGRRHVFHDWKRGGHGRVDGRTGIVQSCDIYFYRLATELGIERVHAGMSGFGFGQRTGIDLPGEPSGLMPSPAWKHRARGEAWYAGETVITGIGQGYFLVTPLQLAAATAVLANRGKRVTPRFLVAVENPQLGARQAVDREAPEPAVSGGEAEEYGLVIESMRDVVHGRRGTARRINKGLRYEMAGKTGTAQVKRITMEERRSGDKNTEKRFADHSLFVGFAPVDEPKIAIAVIVEHAGSGSGTAAPIARRLMDYYLLERLGLFGDEVAAGQ